MGFRAQFWTPWSGRGASAAAVSLVMAMQPGFAESSGKKEHWSASPGSSLHSPHLPGLDPPVYGKEGCAALHSPLKLLQVHVFFRHGDRSPVPTRNAVLDDGSFWEGRLEPLPEGMRFEDFSRGKDHPFGQLTRRGAAQCRALGQMLRQRYGALLDLPPLPGGSQWSDDKGWPLNEDEYVPPNVPSPTASVDQPSKRSTTGRGGEARENAIRRQGEQPLFPGLRIRSTDFVRTYLSGFHVLCGLLGSADLAASVKVVKYSDEEENLFNNDHCQRLALLFRQAMKAAMESGQGHGWRERAAPQAQALAEAIRLSPSPPRLPWVGAVDAVECRHLHGLPLPPNISWADILHFRQELSLEYSTVFASQEIAQLAMGRLIDELLKAMHSAVSPSHPTHSASDTTPPPRLALYSGHDATIAPLLAVIGVHMPTWAHYTSSVIFELWGTEDGRDHFVRVLFNGEPVALPLQPPPPGGSWQHSGPSRLPGIVLCPWDRFEKLASWSRITNEQYHHACKIHVSDTAESLGMESKHV